jgi:hypothetical protein
MNTPHYTMNKSRLDIGKRPVGSRFAEHHGQQSVPEKKDSIPFPHLKRPTTKPAIGERKETSLLLGDAVDDADQRISAVFGALDVGEEYSSRRADVAGFFDGLAAQFLQLGLLGLQV